MACMPQIYDIRLQKYKNIIIKSKQPRITDVRRGGNTWNSGTEISMILRKKDATNFPFEPHEFAPDILLNIITDSQCQAARQVHSRLSLQGHCRWI